MIGAVTAVVLASLVGGAQIGRIDAAATATAPAMRMAAPAMRMAHDVQTAGTILDTTGGGPLHLLGETFTVAQLAAGGPVTIAYAPSSTINGQSAVVVYFPVLAEHPGCTVGQACILIDQAKWASRGTDANRVIIAHEWGHVLSLRFQFYMTGPEWRAWSVDQAAVGEECLADALEAIVIARRGFPPSQTGGYGCPQSALTDRMATQLLDDFPLIWATP